jgi:hypothetical protein
MQRFGTRQMVQSYLSLYRRQIAAASAEVEDFALPDDTLRDAGMA